MASNHRVGILLATLIAYGYVSCFLIVPELPEGDTVAGQVKLDQTYTSPMADPSSAEFQLAAQDFTSFVSTVHSASYP